MGTCVILWSTRSFLAPHDFAQGACSQGGLEKKPRGGTHRGDRKGADLRLLETAREFWTSSQPRNRRNSWFVCQRWSIAFSSFCNICNYSGTPERAATKCRGPGFHSDAFYDSAPWGVAHFKHQSHRKFSHWYAASWDATPFRMSRCQQVIKQLSAYEALAEVQWQQRAGSD